MKIRVKFTREARVKFLGHLDIMRSFQRGFIRGDIKMIYSEGFSPHQKMNFAQPLGVGVISSGEYLDAEVADGQDPNMIKERLNQQMGEGFVIKSVYIIKENADKAMAAVRTASYSVSVNEGEIPEIEPFMAAENVVAVKKTKSGQSEVDIKPLVYKLEKDGSTFTFTVSAGSENNLKPDLLMQEVYRLNNLDFDKNNMVVTRTDLMTQDFTPLEFHQTIVE